VIRRVGKNLAVLDGEVAELAEEIERAFVERGPERGRADRGRAGEPPLRAVAQRDHIEDPDLTYDG
jgi:hypothetical protein